MVAGAATKGNDKGGPTAETLEDAEQPNGIGGLLARVRGAANVRAAVIRRAVV